MKKFTTARHLGVLVVLAVGLGISGFTPKDGFINGYQFYREFEITHESRDSAHYHSEYRVLLSAHQEYKFVVTNCSCDAVIKIYDVNGKLIGTNVPSDDGKCHESIIYRCRATRYYSVIIESLKPEQKKGKKKKESVCQIGFKRF